MIDQVFSDASDQHPWFKERLGPGSVLDFDAPKLAHEVSGNPESASGSERRFFMATCSTSG